jgi:putative serine protease PepD
VLLAFDSDDTTVTTLAPLGPGTATPTSPAAIVAARVIPSIVTVEVSNSNSGDFVADASGSGVVLDAAGTIVTNQHVVDGALRYQVLFADGRTYSASLVGEDALTDLAVLRVDTTGLTPIAL